MRRIRQLAIVGMLVTVFAAVAEAQSLADIARQEAERRKSITTPGKVFTNADLRPAPLPSSPPPAPPATRAEPDVVADAAPEPASAVPPEEDPRTEQYWRRRMADAREQLDRSRQFAEALQTRINVLSADFVNVDDPAQRAVIANDRDRALAELARVRTEIAELEKRIPAIQEEARRAGVPAGWVR